MNFRRSLSTHETLEVSSMKPLTEAECGASELDCYFASECLDGRL